VARHTSDAQMQSEASFVEQAPAGYAVSVSDEAAAFARQNRLWGSLVLMMGLVQSEARPGTALNIDLVSDPEVEGKRAICFTVRVAGEVTEALELDERLRELAHESIPPDDQTHFVFRFAFLD